MKSKVSQKFIQLAQYTSNKCFPISVKRKEKGSSFLYLTSAILTWANKILQYGKEKSGVWLLIFLMSLFIVKIALESMSFAKISRWYVTWLKKEEVKTCWRSSYGTQLKLRNRQSTLRYWRMLAKSLNALPTLKIKRFFYFS